MRNEPSCCDRTNEVGGLDLKSPPPKEGRGILNPTLLRMTKPASSYQLAAHVVSPDSENLVARRRSAGAREACGLRQGNSEACSKLFPAELAGHQWEIGRRKSDGKLQTSQIGLLESEQGDLQPKNFAFRRPVSYRNKLFKRGFISLIK